MEKSILSKGCRGKKVIDLQNLLHLLPDGIFGRLTDEAVRAFQKASGLYPDGIVGPKTWDALIKSNSDGSGYIVKSRRKITRIIVHCTATPEGKHCTVSDIRSWHKKRGWADIGYHYIVYLNGEVHNGRSVDLIGAHCDGYNTGSIGVVYVGGCVAGGKAAKDTRTPEQKEALVNLLKKLRKLYPDAKIYGHRDFSNKACPSFDAKTEYSWI